MCPATAYALIAAEEALSDANWKPTDETDKRDTGVAVGTGMVDLVDICSMQEALNKSYNKVSPFFIPRILPNMSAGQISIKYGFRGPNHSVSTACATGAHAIGKQTSSHFSKITKNQIQINFLLYLIIAFI